MALHLLKERMARPRDGVSIELDQQFVAFQGSAQEALAVYLTGHLILRLDEPLVVKHIHLHLSGIQRILIPTRNTWRHPAWQEEFYKQTWEFHDKYRTTLQVLPPGEQTYPFSVLLDGSLPETVQGMSEASITYSFRAEIDRKNGRDIVCRRPLRIIRLPALYTQELTLDEIWADKIAYRIQVPNTSIAFGTKAELRYSFIPLLGGLRIDHVESQVLESSEVSADESAVSSRVNTTNVICSAKHIIDDGFVGNISKNAEGYHVSHTLYLPRGPGQCVQDTEAMGIRVKHKLKVIVRMKNPDGHLSELRLSIPMSIYLSPDYPVWDPTFDNRSLPPPNINFLNEEPPPPYGRHSLDQLCEPETHAR
ncbi:arrestin family protein [Aspergillus stella-maris]|uniref:arrestin family protein n=1 Tax=Aspergillus stella-maris TaxID=1810926 RepID=UPI003CCD3724